MAELINGMTPESFRTALRHCASKQVCEEICPYYHVPGCIGRLIIESNELVERLESRIAELEAKQPRWISVDERLPDVGQCVLVFVNGLMGIASIISFDMLTDEPMWSCCELGSDPQYWMPLPEPPEEGDK